MLMSMMGHKKLETTKTYYINIDNEPLLAQQERIEVIPTLVLYHNGNVAGSIVAPQSKARIEEFINESLRK